MRDWGVHWRSTEIYGTPACLYVCDVPWWAHGVEWLAECVDTYVFRHRWCAPWDWTFKIPTRSWKSDEDGWYDHSVGSGISSSFQWVVATGHRRETNRMRVDLTDEWLAANGQVDPIGDYG